MTRFTTFFTTAAATLLLLLLPAFAAPLEKRTISQALFDDFVRAAKLSLGGYAAQCASPLGLQRLHTIHSNDYDTDGYIALDPARQEILVVFRGTSSLTDILFVDLDNALVPYTAPGSLGCVGCTIHRGFQNAWNSVARTVIAQVQALAFQYPTYKVVVLGHSLGGAMSTIAGVALEQTFPGKVIIYSLASPRTGSPAFIAHVERIVPQSRRYRITNMDDTVPNDLTEAEGFKHMGPEYWTSASPATPASIVACNGGEDPACNKGHSKENTGFLGINAAHMMYLNVDFGTLGGGAECS